MNTFLCMAATFVVTAGVTSAFWIYVFRCALTKAVDKAARRAQTEMLGRVMRPGERRQEAGDRRQESGDHMSLEEDRGQRTEDIKQGVEARA